MCWRQKSCTATILPLPVLAPGTEDEDWPILDLCSRQPPAGDKTAPAVWFVYSPNRKGEHPQRHLAKFQGILQADAFAGFNKLYEDGTIQEAHAWLTSGASSSTDEAHNSPTPRRLCIA